MASADEQALARFYGLLNRLRTLPGQGRTLAEYSRSGLAKRGVYFFFESGEHRRTDSHEPRVVRVGTHALTSGSNSRLWGRLRSHRGTVSGSGNHRGSIFRLHVGEAILARDKRDLPTWGAKSSAAKEVRLQEAPHELAVSRYIGMMPVLWVSVPDEPGPGSRRGIIERGAIALLSNRMQPLDPASSDWLGRLSSRAQVRESGLWNVNHVSEAPSPEFFYALEEAVAETEASHDHGAGIRR